jgi:NACHT-associated inactive Restriction Endonuclease 1
MSKKEMSIEDNAEFLIAVRNYKCEKREKWSGGIDFLASDVTSGEKVFLRLIEPKSKSGFVGADDVKDMLKVMKRKDCDRGVIISKRFTDAAAQEMKFYNIQQVSDEYMPPMKSENIILTINDCINNLCKTRCGAIPLKESDCKGRLKERLCRIRSISDDALFHYERGWIDLMKNDLRQLLLMDKIESMIMP